MRDGVVVALDVLERELRVDRHGHDARRRCAPRNERTNSSPSGMTSATRSPLTRPRAARCAPRRVGFRVRSRGTSRTAPSRPARTKTKPRASRGRARRRQRTSVGGTSVGSACGSALLRRRRRARRARSAACQRCGQRCLVPPRLQGRARDSAPATRVRMRVHEPHAKPFSRHFRVRDVARSVQAQRYKPRRGRLVPSRASSSPASASSAPSGSGARRSSARSPSGHERHLAGRVLRRRRARARATRARSRTSARATT